MRNNVKLQAHKGVEAEFPENTMPSFRAAVEQGYEFIELDLSVTADEKIVVLHDNVINRTARNPDGSRLDEEARISDITYAKALTYDFGIYFSPEFAGTRIPLFDEVLHLAAEHGTTLKIDNKIQRFTEHQLECLFEKLRQSSVNILVSCWDREIAERVRRKLPLAGISFDAVYDEEQLQELSRIAGSDNLYIWIPIDYSMATWAPADWWNAKEHAERIRQYGKLCIWAIESVSSFEEACRLYSPCIAETTGIIKPEGYTGH